MSTMEKIVAKAHPYTCTCCNEFTGSKDFHKIAHLENSGLVIYRHKIRNEDLDNWTCHIDCNQQTEKQNESEERTIPPDDEVYIVHNTRGIELNHAEFIQALEESKINCKRCKTIYEHAQKLLENIPTFNKDNILGICTHCYMKAQSLGPCTKCLETVNKFAATKDEHNLDKKKRHNAWLSKVNRLLDNIIIDEPPKTVSPSKCQTVIYPDKGRNGYSNRIHSGTVRINDLYQTPSQNRLPDPDIGGSIEYYWDDIKGVMKSKKERPTSPAIHINNGVNWVGEDKYNKLHSDQYKHDIIYNNGEKSVEPMKSIYDVESPRLRISEIFHRGKDKYTSLQKAQDKRSKKYFNDQFVEPNKSQYYLDEGPSKFHINKVPYREDDKYTTAYSEHYKRDILYINDDKSAKPIKSQYDIQESPLSFQSNKGIQKKGDKYPEFQHVADKETKQYLNKQSEKPVNSQYYLESSPSYVRTNNVISLGGDKYTTLSYVQDKYDIRDLNEKPGEPRKSKFTDVKTSKQTYSENSLNPPITTDKKAHFDGGNVKKGNVDKPTTHKRADKRGHDKRKIDKGTTIDKRSVDKLTPDSSKQLNILKSSKHPKKIESDETMITSISRATIRSRQKDLVYFFPKDLKKKPLQPQSYVSSSTLIKKTRQKFKTEEVDKKRKDEENKRKLEDEGKMLHYDRKKSLAQKINIKLNTPVSTAATTVTKIKISQDPEKSKSITRPPKSIPGSPKTIPESPKSIPESMKTIKGEDKKMRKVSKLDQKLMEKPKEKEAFQPVKKTEVSFTEVDKLDLKNTVKGKDQDLKNKKQEVKEKPGRGNGDRVNGAPKIFKLDRNIEIDPSNIKPFKSHASTAHLVLHFSEKREIGPIPTIGSSVLRTLHSKIKRKHFDPYISSNTDLPKKQHQGELIFSEDILKYKPLPMDKVNDENFKPTLYQTFFGEELTFVGGDRIDNNHKAIEAKPARAVTSETEGSKGIIRYALSDRTFIEKGWTMLPTEKVVRRMNVYRMRPARPNVNFFENNKNKEPMYYDTGEKLAEFDENGRGQLYYKNGRLALDYYDTKESNAQQRFVVYSNGEPDQNGRTHPITVLGTFDYLGNGVVFDHVGKIRLKYNQTEGVVLDRGIGPVSHWKWHALNDPPVLQQVMIDTTTAYKDPEIIKLGLPIKEAEKRQDNEDMLAIEFENFVREKNKKLAQEYKPYQIRMKALKINDHFSLKVLDQATVYLIYRDGLTNVKLNIGMLLDHREIVDTDTAELGEVANNVERLPSRSDSLASLRRTISFAQHTEQTRINRERKRRLPKTCSEDRMMATTSRPLQSPLRIISTAEKCYCNRKPCSKSLYYNTRIM